MKRSQYNADRGRRATVTPGAAVAPGSTAGSLRLAACELCAEAVALRYRVQHRDDRIWRLVCPACQARVSADNPNYRYGGTWKAKRRR